MNVFYTPTTALYYCYARAGHLVSSGAVLCELAVWFRRVREFYQPCFQRDSIAKLQLECLRGLNDTTNHDL